MTRLNMFYILKEKIADNRSDITKAAIAMNNMEMFARSIDLEINWETFEVKDISKCSIGHECHFIPDPPDWQYCTTCGKIKPLKSW